MKLFVILSAKKFLQIIAVINMEKKLLTLVIISVFFIMNSAYSQDPSFSQFYANPVYLNPAMAGSSDCGRLSLNYNNQWPGITNSFVTYSVSYDQFVDKLSGGLGIIMNFDVAGDGILKTSTISGTYSYKLQVNENLFLNAALQGGYYNKQLDWDKLVFGSEVDPSDPNFGSSEVVPDNLSFGFADFATGILLAINDNIFAGFAAHHLTQPNISFYKNEDSKLEIKYTAHAGARLHLSQSNYKRSKDDFKQTSVSPNILYQKQGDFQQLNVGVYFNLYPFVFGTWYRHAFENPNSITALVGLRYNKFNFGYSYDYAVSQINKVSGGSHEISFTWHFNCNKKINRYEAIKCPSF